MAAATWQTGGNRRNTDANETHTVNRIPSSMAKDHVRSCTTCRRRKVRCNKRQPCAGCLRAGTDCIFPAPGRKSRTAKSMVSMEVLDRLRKLEGVVQALGGLPEESDVTENETNRRRADGNRKPQSQPHLTSIEDEPDQEFGRLVIDDTRSRYVSNKILASLGDKIEEMRDLLHQPSSSDEGSSSEELNRTPPTSAGSLLGFYSLAHSLQDYHPLISHQFTLWETFQKNVAPLVKVFHMPTLTQMFFDATIAVDSLNKHTETLMFAIYYSAITSMTTDQCRSLLDEDRSITLKKYRFATEQALARANFLNTQNTVLLQAVVLFLTAVRHEDDSRYVWSIASLSFRIAQAMGLHRDGTAFGLTPFETEIRRRLWWHICVLDLHASEDHGCEPIVHEAFFDTKLPLNINDADISPKMTDPPKERIGVTEMTPCLIRCEATLAFRRLSHVPLGIQRDKWLKDGSSLPNREAAVEALNRRFNERYVQHCDASDPLSRVCVTIARLTIAKIWLIVHYPAGRKDYGYGANLPLNVRDRLLSASIEVIELSALLAKDIGLAQWNWFFKTHKQWQSVALVLSEICTRPRLPVSARTWDAVVSVYDWWEMAEKEKNGTLSQPLRKLMLRAKNIRGMQQKDQIAGGRQVNIDESHFRVDTGLSQPEIDSSAARSVERPRSSHLSYGGDWQFDSLEAMSIEPFTQDLQQGPRPEQADSSISEHQNDYINVIDNRDIICSDLPDDGEGDADLSTFFTATGTINPGLFADASSSSMLWSVWDPQSTPNFQLEVGVDRDNSSEMPIMSHTFQRE